MATDPEEVAAGIHSSTEDDTSSEDEPAGDEPAGSEAGGNFSESSVTATNFSIVIEDFNSSSGLWDPLASPDWERATYPPQCYMRIRRDLKEYQKNPPPGIFLVPRSENISVMDFLVMGPSDTPYAGGFFHFVLRCPPEYPIRPPRVRLMTTGNNTVRFNPNLYKCGKVCLSILGTWSGPAWTAALGLSSLMVSIQSLMNEKPYHNEPGFEIEHLPGSVEKYNLIIAHETLRVAVSAVVADLLMDDMKLPESIRQAVLKKFYHGFDSYVKQAEALLPQEGNAMDDPFGGRRGTFGPKAILEQLQTLRTKLTEADYPFLKEKGDAEVFVDPANEDPPMNAFSAGEPDPNFFLESLCDEDSDSAEDADMDDGDDEENEEEGEVEAN